MLYSPKKKRVYFFGALGFMYVTMACLAFILLQVESSAPNGNIKTFADAFWTLQLASSTIGYGDFFPVTTIGRVIVIFEFYVGVALIGFLGAVFAERLFGFPDTSIRNRDLKNQSSKIMIETKIMNKKLDALSSEIQDLKNKV